MASSKLVTIDLGASHVSLSTGLDRAQHPRPSPSGPWIGRPTARDQGLLLESF